MSFTPTVKVTRDSSSCGTITLENTSTGYDPTKLYNQELQLTDKTTNQVYNKNVPIDETVAVFEGIPITSTLFVVELIIAGQGFLGGDFSTDCQYPCVPGATSQELQLPLY